MKRIQIILTFVLLSISTFPGCTTDEPITVVSHEVGLIANSSFEVGFSPSLYGWETNITDTSVIHFAKDAPVGGGLYSVWLKNQWTFPGEIKYKVIPPNGTHRYRLSVWGKAIRTNSLPSSGSIMLVLKHSDTDSLLSSIYFSDSVWTFVSEIDKLTTTTADTLLIMLRGNPGQFTSGYVQFDLCKLVKLE